MTVSSANAGVAWVDSFLAQAKATDDAAAKTRKAIQPPELPENATPEQMRAHAAASQQFSDELQRSIDTAISSGNVLRFDAPATPIQSTVAAVSFSGFDDSSSVTRTAESGQPAAQQGTEVLPVAMAATFGGFDDVPATVQETPTATVVADARAAVAPSVAMNFSGFDEVETHDAPTVQDMRSKDGKVRTA